ncbi:MULTISPECIES: sensor histidine kinase [unclassified Rathayibacter]|uniref:sensor histidine kinase n=1 Tax=unclassified Rathayibacter TaxID=2609250 RepID=UPI000CE91BFA|nr:MULTISPECIES: sensor histidine kinase [unclassified Rathayibacter]PPF23960.1 hypothetical protein C5C54_17050 [Rathayibacter sp. AY1F2]PPH41123.1 hypothetical protein C5C42_16915 [Rathayibacter sp. AY1F7]
MSGLLRRIPLRAVDVAVAVAFVGFWWSAEAGRLAGPDGLTRGAVLLLIALVIAIGVRRPWIAAGAAAVMVTVSLLLLDYESGTLWPSAMGVAYIAARTGAQTMTRGRWLLSVVLVVAGCALALPTGGPVFAAVLAGVVVLAWAGGHLFRVRRERARLLAEQRVLTQGLEDAGRELNLISERARIARDVHDIMAQSLSIVLAQADGAARLVRADPGRAQASLGVISDVARSSLVEVRMLIESIGPSPVTLDQPTLSELPHLIERFDSAGLTVGFAEDGERLTLTEGQQLAVYRIVQEALTNALRYSGDRPNAFVRLLWNGTALLLEVTSHGRPGREPSVGSGMGVAGMKERAELAGGWLTAEGTDGDGSFVVTASIPAPDPERGT